MVTKKQHYVPQLLLRRFAVRAGAEERINVFDIARRQFRRNQSIKEVCSGNYTYDRDNTVEKFLNEHIEGPVVEELERLANSSGSASPVPSPSLLQFILVQLARTRQAYHGNMDFINSMMQTVFAEAARLNELDPSVVSRLRLEPKEPREVLAYLAVCAATQYRLLSDLAVSVIVNPTSEEFIISDHPVFQHNWYLRDSTELFANAITVRGVQFFLPISPSLTCCLYDASVYAYRSQSRREGLVASLEDVRILNSFQALNADTLLMAKSEQMAGTLSELGDRYSDAQAFTASATCTHAIPVEDGKLRSTHIARRIQTRIPAMPSFVKVKNKVRRRPVECSHRCPDIVRIQELLDQKNGVRRNAL
jgi:hypothetical protein